MSFHTQLLKLLPFGLLILLSACKSQFEAPPSGTLDQSKMVFVLIRVQLLEAELEAKAVPKDSARKVFKAEEARIYREAGTTEKQFKQSYQFYLRNTALLDRIYAVVVDSLSFREGMATKKIMEGQAE